MNFPRLGQQDVQFGNIYGMSRDARQSGVFPSLVSAGETIGSALMDKAAADRQNEKDRLQGLNENEFMQNYGQGAISGKLDISSFYPAASAVSPGLAENIMSARKASEAEKMNAAQLESKNAIEAAKIEQKREDAGSSKQNMLNEMKALTYNINTTANPAQKQMLSDMLGELNNQYITQFGAVKDTSSAVNPSAWLKSYTEGIALPSYGVNPDGTISDTTKLKSDIKAAAAQAGITVLDKDIENWVDSKNADLERSYRSGTEKTMTQLEVAKEQEDLRQRKLGNAYEIMDKKYPNLRTGGIELVNSAITFVTAGDEGDISARNNLVKKISRMGSDEALTDTDFGRALGRSMGTSFANRVASAVTGSDLPITDQEWSKLRDFAKRYVDEIRTTAHEADPSGKLLRPIKPWPGGKNPAGQAQKKTGQTKSGTKWEIVE